jgi:chromosome segregation ATPase
MNALNRLIEISTQLSNLNEKLRSELQDSKKSSSELQNMLEISRMELDALRKELSALRTSSEELLSKAENSQTELNALQTVLRKAESSLTSLELSFAAYREASENRIRVLEKEKRRWKWGFIAAGVLAAGFGAAFIIK